MNFTRTSSSSHPRYGAFLSIIASSGPKKRGAGTPRELAAGTAALRSAGVPPASSGSVSLPENASGRNSERRTANIPLNGYPRQTKRWQDNFNFEQQTEITVVVQFEPRLELGGNRKPSRMKR